MDFRELGFVGYFDLTFIRNSFFLGGGGGKRTSLGGKLGPLGECFSFLDETLVGCELLLPVAVVDSYTCVKLC